MKEPTIRRVNVKSLLSASTDKITDRELILKLLPLTGVIYILSAAIEFARVGRDSYFLSVLGASGIPHMYIYIAIAALLLSLGYAKIVDSLSVTSFQFVLLLFCSMIFALLWLLMIYEALPIELFSKVLFCSVDERLLSS